MSNAEIHQEFTNAEYHEKIKHAELELERVRVVAVEYLETLAKAEKAVGERKLVFGNKKQTQKIRKIVK